MSLSRYIGIPLLAAASVALALALIAMDAANAGVVTASAGALIDFRVI